MERFLFVIIFAIINTSECLIFNDQCSMFNAAMNY